MNRTPRPDPHRLDWQADAACRGPLIIEGRRYERGQLLGLFFPDEGRRSHKQIDLAKRICHDYCPVRIACLRWALDTFEPDGIWGGLDPAERDTAIRARQRRRIELDRADQPIDEEALV